MVKTTFAARFAVASLLRPGEGMSRDRGSNENARASAIRSADECLDVLLPKPGHPRSDHIPAGAGRHLGRPTQVAGLGDGEPLLMQGVL
jgi:hypothetical protein